MAITRAQQAKQLLAQGGRIGFQGGGKDLGKGASGAGSGRGMGPAGGASAGGNYGGNRNPEQEYGGSIFSGGGGGGDGPKTTPTNVGGGDGPKFDIFNPIDSIKAKLLDYAGVTLEDVVRAKSLEDDDEDTGGVDQSTIDALFDPKVASDIQKVTTQTSDLLNQDPDLMSTLGLGKAEGGIASLDREAFLLGGIAKGLKKAVRGVKKLVKSPIGKAALLGGLAYFGGGGGLPKFLSGKGLGGFSMKTLFSKANPLLFTEGKLSLGKLALASAATPFLFPGEKKDEFNLDAYYAANQLNPNAPPNTRIAGSQFDFYGGQTAADGGRIGYQEGGDAEPVAKKTMPLLDMDGKEKDYRETGGFVDMGRMERADDVPARLSKNEFVFTADAVRNAGEGDIDKGAEVMYNMMKNLEAGGEVSEESQGLEGAREMFQTSQRLGEVI